MGRQRSHPGLYLFCHDACGVLAAAPLVKIRKPSRWIAKPPTVLVLLDAAVFAGSALPVGQYRQSSIGVPALFRRRQPVCMVTFRQTLRPLGVMILRRAGSLSHLMDRPGWRPWFNMEDSLGGLQQSPQAVPIHSRDNGPLARYLFMAFLASNLDNKPPIDPPPFHRTGCPAHRHRLSAAHRKPG